MVVWREVGVLRRLWGLLECVCVCMCVEMYKEGVGIFYKFVSYEVGDGSQVRFWHDL
jgi:hypothetical protein